MWTIITTQITKETTAMSIQIDFDHELFESYLQERSKLNPAYIHFNTHWINIVNPFQPFVCPIPYNGAHCITIDREMKIGFPSKCLPFYRERYQRAIVKRLFEWLGEEYKNFQKEWLENAN